MAKVDANKQKKIETTNEFETGRETEPNTYILNSSKNDNTLHNMWSV